MMSSTSVRASMPASCGIGHARASVRARRAQLAISLRAEANKTGTQTSEKPQVLGGLIGAAAAAAMALAGPAVAEIRLPPIDSDPNRCERAFDGNTIGQANAVSDRVLDLRKCEYDGADLSAKTLSGALMSDASFKNAKMQEVVMSKAYAVGSSFQGADMTNAVLDRVEFSNADLKNVNFTNAVITGVFWDGADLEGATFEDALIGGQDAKNLCSNPTLKGDSRYEVGCRN